jgi:hypothetical protein
MTQGNGFLVRLIKEPCPCNVSLVRVHQTHGA